MEDDFKGVSAGFTSPATKHFAIQPDDNSDLPILPRVIYCQTEGTIVIRDKEGVNLAYTLMAGDQLPFRGVRVLSTGTTGTYYGWS